MKYLITLSFLFFVSEILLVAFKRSKKIESKKQKDSWSLRLLWIAISLCFTFGFIFAKYEKWDLTNYIVALLGLLIMLIGIVIRWTSIIQLSSAFTVDVAIVKDHKLKTDGVYRYVRHPSYLGLLLIMVGFAVCMNSILSFFIVVIPILMTLLYRIYVEERILMSEFEDFYIDYKCKTKKLIPFVF